MHVVRTRPVKPAERTLNYGEQLDYKLVRYKRSTKYIWKVRMDVDCDSKQEQT